MPLPADPTTELEAEQLHLTESRTQLARMRERTAVIYMRIGVLGLKPILAPLT